MRTTQLLILTLIIVVTTTFMASCSQPGQAAQIPKEKKEIASNIETTTVQPGNLAEIVSVTGTVLPNRDVTFSAETAGRVERLQVELGDRIRKGQSLARIDYDMLKAQYDQAKANHQLAVKTLNRIQQLKNDELASQQQLDEAVTQEQVASANLRIAGVQLQKSTVVSTLNGIVARKMVEQGEYVNPGQPILQVVEFHTVVISAQVPENLVSKIRRDMPVKVNIPSLGTETQGKVHVVVPAAHPDSRTFELRVKTPNPEYKILIGMSTSLEIIVDKHINAVVVPIDTVIESGGTKNVFMERDGKVELRPVDLGPTQGDQVIVNHGISVGEQLVIEGHRDLFDGQSVRVVSPLPAERSASETKSQGQPSS